MKGADEGLGWGDPLAVSGKDLGVESDWHPLGPGGGAWHPTPGLSDTIQLTSSFENTLLFKVVRFVLSVFFGSPVVVSLTVASPLRTKMRPDPKTEDSLIAEKKATWESSTHGPHLGWNPENDSLNHPLKKTHMKTTNIWGKNLSMARRKQMVRGIP